MEHYINFNFPSIDMEESAQLQTPIAVMGSTKQEPDITKWSMNSKELFTQLGHDLRGEICKKNSLGLDEWRKPEGAKTMMNDAGIVWLFAALRPITDKYAMQGNITRDEAMFIGKQTSKRILEGLHSQRPEFEIHAIQYNILVTIVLNIVHFAVTRPIDGKERQAMHESSEVHRYYTGSEMQQPQKGGLHIPIIGSLFR